MTNVLIGAADQSVATELRTFVAEIEGAEVTGYVESTPELSAHVAATRPDVVIIHDQLGPQTTPEIVREVVSRAPSTGVLVINSTGNAQAAIEAMEAGAKGVLGFPLSFDDLLTKFAGAQQWSQQMSGLLATSASANTSSDLGRNGRLTVFAGSKGGVGTTTVATHMAIDLQRRIPGVRVLLVDLDLQAGDVSGIIEARQRVSIADVAKVSDDLSVTTILDAIVRHESGISLLLTPMQVHETDHVTPTAVRSMLSLLRHEFDVILVDGGSHATPAQAAAVEVADEVVTVVTQDVLAMRGYRRLIQSWEGLGVREEQNIHLLLNKTSRDDVLNADTIAKLTSAPLVSVRLPSVPRQLERGVNARNPVEVREATWWSALERIGSEIGVYAGGAHMPTAEPVAPKKRNRRSRAESGQVALETVGLLPIVVLCCLLAWQGALVALAFEWNGHAANAAARAASMTGGEPQQAAEEAVPAGIRDNVKVDVLPSGAVNVSTSVPLLCPGCAVMPKQISQTAQAVDEP